ncbi:hypothetical protein AAFF_G00051840 [Aldrovandia affinis]|uniref:Uncharacterized protein n=1 Tax=Aldrovandia affinis TaxID=143900 RepID=A0AAD7WZX8_9TELE|nr:hypothetical protein AAFF_G00051840 [Aldrovandia affinis]
MRSWHSRSAVPGGMECHMVPLCGGQPGGAARDCGLSTFPRAVPSLCLPQHQPRPSPHDSALGASQRARRSVSAITATVKSASHFFTLHSRHSERHPCHNFNIAIYLRASTY